MTSDLAHVPRRCRRETATTTALVLAITVVVLGTAVYAQPMLERWVTEPGTIVEQVARLRLLLAGMATLVGCSIVGVALVLWRHGHRMVAGQQTAPVCAEWLRTARALTGGRAIRQGRLAQVLAGLLATCVVGQTAVWWRLGLLLNP